MGDAVRQVIIRGRVQGVGFRYWTRRTATARGLLGWVRNRRDGSVEAVFAGDENAVADMIALCRRGPDTARGARRGKCRRPGTAEPAQGQRTLFRTADGMTSIRQRRVFPRSTEHLAKGLVKRDVDILHAHGKPQIDQAGDAVARIRHAAGDDR